MNFSPCDPSMDSGKSQVSGFFAAGEDKTQKNKPVCSDTSHKENPKAHLYCILLWSTELVMSNIRQGLFCEKPQLNLLISPAVMLNLHDTTAHGHTVHLEVLPLEQSVLQSKQDCTHHSTGCSVPHNLQHIFWTAPVRQLCKDFQVIAFVVLLHLVQGKSLYLLALSQMFP